MMEVTEIVVGSVFFFALAVLVFCLSEKTVVEKTGLSAKVILPAILGLLIGDWVSLPLDIANSQVNIKFGSIIVPIFLGCFFLFARPKNALRYQSFILLFAYFMVLLLGDSFFAAQVTWPSTYLFGALIFVSAVMIAFVLQDYGAFLGVNFIAIPLVFIVQGLWRAKLVSIVHIGGSFVYSILAVTSMVGIIVIYFRQQRAKKHFFHQVLSADK